MSKTHITEMYIKPLAKQNQLVTTLLGLLFLLCSLFFSYFFWANYKLHMMMFFLISCIVLLCGIVKLLQPSFSFKLCRMHLHYFHPWGQWHVPWRNIKRFNVVACECHFKQVNLPYIGVQLTNLSVIAQTVSPRLANKLLHEQKELFVMAIKCDLLPLNTPIINFNSITIDDIEYKGHIAAWLHRCNDLHHAYGYHLFIAEDALDRPKHDFLTFINRVKQSIID